MLLVFLIYPYFCIDGKWNYDKVKREILKTNMQNKLFKFSARLSYYDASMKLP